MNTPAMEERMGKLPQSPSYDVVLCLGRPKGSNGPISPRGELTLPQQEASVEKPADETKPTTRPSPSIRLG